MVSCQVWGWTGVFLPPGSCGTPGRLRCLAGSPHPVPAAEPITGHWGRKTTFPAWNDISSDPQPSEAATAISSSSFCWRMDRYGVKDRGEGQGLRAHPGWGRAGPTLPRCHHPGACWSSVLPAAHRGRDSPAAGHQLRLPGKRRWVFSCPCYQHPPITVCSSPGHFICPFHGQLPGLERPSSSSCDTRLSHYCLLNREQKCLSEVSVSPPAPSLLLTCFESLVAEQGWLLVKDSLPWQGPGEENVFYKS